MGTFLTHFKPPFRLIYALAAMYTLTSIAGVILIGIGAYHIRAYDIHGVSLMDVVLVSVTLFNIGKKIDVISQPSAMHLFLCPKSRRWRSHCRLRTSCSPILFIFNFIHFCIGILVLHKMMQI